jgi:5,10-methylenetetrahydromethanopterin reductase
MTMEFGVCLPCVYPPEEFVRHVRRIDELGYRYLWLTDMVLETYDVFAYFTLAALNSRHVRLGACVLHPHVRHFGVLLNGMVTVDQISKGRAVFGIGTGGADVVAELGFKPATIGVMRELLTASRRLLRGETVDSDLPPLQMRQARLRHSPRATLRIYLAASGPRTLELGGELADGIFAHVGASPETVRFAREACERGRTRRADDLGSLDFSPFLHTSIAGDRSVALAECRKGALRVATRFPHYAELVGYGPDQVAALRRGGPAAAEAVGDELVDRLTLSGTVDDCIRKIERLATIGVTHLTIFPVGNDNTALIETLGREILPRFR